MHREIEIPKANLETFLRKLEYINKRAAKIGCPPISFEVTREFDKMYRYTRRTFAEGHWQQVEAHAEFPTVAVRVEGAEPKIEGWDFVGYVNIKNAFIDKETGEFKKAGVRGPGVIDFADRQGTLEAVRGALNSKGQVCCDHCNTVRNRKLAFVLRSEEDGRDMVVGSTCVQDFTGHDPVKVSKWYDFIRTSFGEVSKEIDRPYYSVIEETDWTAYYKAMEEKAAEESKEYDPVPYLALVSQFATSDGWNNGEAAERAIEATKSGEVAEESHAEYAKEALSWASDMGFRQDDLWKQRDRASSALRGGRLTASSLKELAAILTAYSVHSGKPLNGEFFGSTKAKEEPEGFLEVRSVREIWEEGRRWDSDPIKKLLHWLQDSEGHLFRTITRPDRGHKKGEILDCAFHVNEHRITTGGKAFTDITIYEVRNVLDAMPQDEATPEPKR